MTTIKSDGEHTKIYNDIGEQAFASNVVNGNGLNPKELLEASLALCHVLVTKKLLTRDGIAYDAADISATVEATKDPDGKNHFSDFNVTLTLPKHLEADYIQKLLVSVERACTIGNTLQANARIHVTQK
ncbi:OsmC family protein [Kurthia massiliensis]|uniref:OsmC family protein n=1 Tax=Kurthia massiliensis TaxID=1033739 RepID=UPI000288FA04|nr:OsmC family protein [Kurthia massiliensis]